MESMDIEQALQQLKQAQNDPQKLAVTTAQIACAQLHPDLFAVLEAAAIPHWFDADMLFRLLETDATKANKWLELLIQLPMVESYAARRAWNVNETTRLTIRTKLAKTNSKQFKTLTGRCADYFSGSEDTQRIEQIYHLLASSETVADNQLLDLYHDLRRAGRYDAQHALALVLEELLQSNLMNSVNLARTMVVRGWILGRRMSLLQADAQARQAIYLFVEAGDEYGEAEARKWLGSTLQSEGRLKDAVLQFRSQMSIMRRLTERDPDNSDWLRDLSVSHYLVASILEKQGQLLEALVEREAGLFIAERLAALDATNQQWQQDLQASRQALVEFRQRIAEAGK